MSVNVECGACQGHGLGSYSSEASRCPSCGGRGFFKVETDEPSWIEHCEENGLDPDTGEEN